MTYDIDGIVVELQALAAINVEVNYLQLKLPLPPIANHFHIIKKHFDPTPSLELLKRVHRTYIAVTDGGYLLNFTVLPPSLTGDDGCLSNFYGQKFCRTVLLDLGNIISVSFNTCHPLT